MQAIIRSYEQKGYFDEVLALLEAGLSLERAHVSGICLWIIFILMIDVRWVSSRSFPYYIANIDPKNVSERLKAFISTDEPFSVMEHLKLFVSRINVPKVIRSAESAHLWSELVFLYVKYDEFVSVFSSQCRPALNRFLG